MIYINANTKFIGGSFKAKDIKRHFKEVKDLCDDIEDSKKRVDKYINGKEDKK